MTILICGAADTAKLGEYNGMVDALAFSPDGQTLACGSNNGTVSLWNVASCTRVAALDGHEGLIRSMAFTPDGHILATGSDDSTVRLWDVAPGKCITALTGHLGTVSSLAFSSDGRMLASAPWSAAGWDSDYMQNSVGLWPTTQI